MNIESVARAVVPFALLAGMLQASQAQEVTREEFLTNVYPLYQSSAETLELERQFADLVRTDDTAGIKQLARAIEDEYGPALQKARSRPDLFIEGLTPGDIDQSDPDLEMLYMMGPCGEAGLQLRHVVVETAKGNLEPVFRADTVMLDDSELDNRISMHLDYCQLIREEPLSEQRLFGTRCIRTGVCLGDPDVGL